MLTQVQKYHGLFVMSRFALQCSVKGKEGTNAASDECQVG